jgi:cystathionine beta-lyase
MPKMKSMRSSSARPETLCVHGGRNKHPKPGFVNPPSTRGSTYVYPTMEALKQGQSNKMKPDAVSYGRYGSQTTRELEHAIASLDGAFGAMVTSSGFSAVSTAILGCVSTGDHILMIDTAYAPSRFFCTKTLKRLGIDTTFYSPDAGADIEELIQENTRLIFMESPGSLTFEVQDLQALQSVAALHNIVTILDNTWATSINYPAITNGFNISVQSATKYIGGHSDLMMGIITADESHWLPVRSSYVEFGHSPGTEETTLALRGLRTLPCRLKQHGQSALKVASWLESREEVAAVYFPALQSSPYHSLFESQFSAPSGLFSFLLKSQYQKAVAALVDDMGLFSIGESWGGYESLILPSEPRSVRTAKPWTQTGQLIRLSIGLEHPDDLIADLSAGFIRLNENS